MGQRIFECVLSIGTRSACNRAGSRFAPEALVTRRAHRAGCGAGEAARELEDRYPDILNLINNPMPPVVLELSGIEETRLSNEDGSKPVKERIEQYRAAASNLRRMPSFRIDNVTPADVIAVHDLRDWSLEDISPPPWTPDQDRVAAARRTPRDWLRDTVG
jgi:hypothetical protein